jgi:hypothetical protein
MTPPNGPAAELKFTFSIHGNEILSQGKKIGSRNKFRRRDLFDVFIAAYRFLHGANLPYRTLNLKIFGDAKKLPFIEYCVTELLVNAFDAIRDQGKVQLTLSDHQDQVEILCEDNGAGILRPEQLFELGTSDKLPETNNRGWTIGGGGAALYYIRKTLKYLKGDIRVQETGPQGTRIQVLIPKNLPNWKTVRKALISGQIHLRLLGYGLTGY